jgi:uncharacterized membrane protein (DUF373 family)
MSDDNEQQESERQESERQESERQESERHGASAVVSVLQRTQDILSLSVGAVLIALAGAELISGIVDFLTGVRKLGFEPAGTNLLDRVLLVLILVEIVHTVVLSLRAHRLVAQPFIIVGLVAVIRRILIVLSGSETIPTAELSLLIAMIFVFVAALIAVTWFDRRAKDGGSDLDTDDVS